MSSIPYSRYLIYPVPWYSFLIMIGASVAIFLASRNARRIGLPKDTVLDLALWVLPCGIIGARLYYVLFSWNQFCEDPLAVLRIWEGGLAIYGGLVAGLIALFVFCRKRSLSALLLCDLLVPGVSLAQSIGRWGNWFNIEAYGITVTRQSLCFFPFAIQVPEDHFAWHLATFFFESVWDFAVFLFLISLRRRHHRKKGDLLFLYLFLYASGRAVIEELRVDSLYASSVRISQFLSVILCICILFRYVHISYRQRQLSRMVQFCLFPLSVLASAVILFFILSKKSFIAWPAGRTVLLLSVYAVTMILCMLSVYFPLTSEEVSNAND